MSDEATRASGPTGARAGRAGLGPRIALGVLGALALVAALAPLLAPHSPAAQLDIVGMRSTPPSSAHPFGTDVLSRDVLSRVLHGARVSLGVAFVATTVATALGALWGGLAAVAPRWLDVAMMRVVDALLSLPRVLILLVVAAVTGPLPPWALGLALGATGWLVTSRLVRAEVRLAGARDFAVAARALGAGPARVLVRHLLPHATPQLAVAATLGLADAIAIEAGLSFLGIGVRPPTPSWGGLMHDGADDLFGAWWLTLFPALFVVATIAASTVLGEWARERARGAAQAHDETRTSAPGGARPRALLSFRR